MSEPDDLSGPVFASVDTDARAAREWLAAEFGAQAQRGEPVAMSPAQLEGLRKLSRLMWWADGAADSTDLIASVLPAAVRAAAGIPGGSPALALYLRNVVNEAWGLSWGHGRLRLAVDTACDAWQQVQAVDVTSDLATACWDLLRFLNTEFDVESALLTGRLGVSLALAERAAGEAEALLASIAAVSEQPGREVALREIRNETTYYATIRDAVAAADSVLRRESSTAAPELRRLARQVAAADLNPTDASELRGHLSALEAMVAVEDRDWLRVDQGHCRFVYPFGLRSAAPGVGRQVIGQVVEQAAAWQLGGLAVTAVAEGLEVSDAWQGTDPLGRAYGGAVVRLDDLVVEDAAGLRLDTITAEIRFSELGNHAIVFEVEIADALPGRLAEIVQLASPVFGDLTELSDHLRLRPALDPAGLLPRLAGVVGAVLTDLRRLLSAGGDPVTVSVLEGSFGVITRVERATALTGNGAERVDSAPELLSLFGVEPLVHPLPSGAASVADWAAYDIKDVRTYKLLHLNDELLAANANVSLLASFRSPSYAVGDIESYLEFAHSLHGLYQGWRETVREHAQTIAEILHEVDAALPDAEDDTREVDVDGLGRLAVRIERAELRLQMFVQSNQATMLFVDSPTLVTSPALRIDLDTVLRSNRYDSLRAEFERAVSDVLGSRLQELLAICHRRVEQDLESRREVRDRWVDRVSEAAGIGLALIGVSGLVSVLQAGFDLKGEVTWWLVAGIVAFALLIGLGMYVLSGELAQRTTRRRSRGDEVNPAGGDDTVRGDTRQ